MTDKEQAKQTQLKREHAIVDRMQQNSVTICPSKESGNYTYDTLKKIIVFIEDTGSGFEFFKSFFTVCYPYANIEMVPLEGFGNIKYIPKYNYNTNYDYQYTIIIYDRGRSSCNTQISDNNRKDIPQAIKKLKKRNEQTKIYVFSPLCFESIPLSFSKLLSDLLVKYPIKKDKYTQLHNELVDLLNERIEVINWWQYMKSGQSVENLIEESIENITKGTSYEIMHSPSSISKCWVENCAPSCNRKNITYCNMLKPNSYGTVHKEKLEWLARFSALGGLTYIMDKIFGIKYREYPVAISSDASYKSKLIIEEA